MNTKSISLNQYGTVLTGREFGTQVWRQISEGAQLPSEIDFDGVEAMGSSFGDEVIPPLARAHGNRLSVRNVNEDMKATIEDIASDAGLVIDFL